MAGPDSLPARDRAEVRIFPPAVPLLTILVGAGLHRFWPADLGLPAPERYWVGGLALFAIVSVLGLWPVVLFRRSGQSEKPWTPTSEVVIRGPYRFTRNPMYLQMVLGCALVAVILSNLWVLILTPLCAWILNRFAIGPEEAYLEAKFGDGYRGYKSRVRRWL